MSWLWKSDASSPASFEKALSKLSAQISTASASLEATRSRGRRVKALWTLWSSLAYLISLLILVLVIGPQDWSLPHYGGLLGGPVLIYSVRRAISAAFEWRTGRQQSSLEHLQKQREGKIADLKKATRYDSTQELLQKYGGGPPKETPTKESPQSKKKPMLNASPQARTGLPPPPTANIQRRPDVAPSTPQRPMQHTPQQQGAPPGVAFQPEEPGFAPNAFSAQQPLVGQQGPGWADRLLDLLMGEDETQAKNRLVLLCQNCRLVNGQAPPGIRSLEELGRWRCASCGAWNGVESEMAKVVKEITNHPHAESHDIHTDDSGEEKPVDLQEYSGDVSGKGTGTEAEAGVTKRVTRSAGEEPVEGL